MDHLLELMLVKGVREGHGLCTVVEPRPQYLRVSDHYIGYVLEDYTFSELPEIVVNDRNELAVVYPQEVRDVIDRVTKQGGL